METNPTETNPPFPRPAFIVGITGHMKFTDKTRAALEKKLRAFFEWLRSDAAIQDLHPDLQGLGLSPVTPVRVLSCMAPGADHLMVEVSNSMASTWRAENKGELSVYGMLPLVPKEYANATTYDAGFPLADKAKHAMLALGPDEYQVVRLFKHERKTPEELEKRHKELATATAEPERPERHECYQAAGERVAAYCHLLIAITDGVEDHPEQEVEPGAKRILNVKLRGLTPELTSGSTALSFADTGPVFWLNAFSYKDGEPPTFKFLDPSDKVYEHGHRKAKDLLCATGERNLRAIASALDRYNQEPLDAKTTTKAPAEWRNALNKGKDAECGDLVYEDLPVLGKDQEGALQRIGKARRVAADLSAQYAERMEGLHWWLHMLAFIAVFFLGLYEHWEPEGMSMELSGVRGGLNTVFLSAAIVSILVAIGLYVQFIFNQHIDQRKDDYRAIAEGLRAQFYWTTTGMAESVASYYLLRQRDALSWLRSAMRSVSWPFRPARDGFDKLEDPEKIALFKRTLECWLNAQYCYFKDKVHKLSVREERLHLRSRVLLLCALGFLIVGHLWEDCGCDKGIEHFVITNYFVVVLAWAMLIGWVLYLERERAARSASPPDGEHADRSEAQHRRQTLLKLFITVVRSLLLIIAVIGTFILAVDCCPGLPPVHNLMNLARMFFLAAGGLSHLFIGASYLAEDLRRYDAMRALFLSACERLRWHIAAMERTQGTAAFGGHVRDAQELLKGLGHEAIHENTEWLTNHRDRPIEPVMPG